MLKSSISPGTVLWSPAIAHRTQPLDDGLLPTQPIDISEILGGSAIEGLGSSQPG